jgi:hypothetical protein
MCEGNGVRPLGLTRSSTRQEEHQEELVPWHEAQGKQGMNA